MFLITQSSRKKSVYLSCERYGKGRITRKNIDVESRKFTGTKKCQCPFTLTGKMERQSVWRLYIQNGKHNHPAAIYHHGHGFVSRLSKEQLVTAATLTKSHVKPKEILDHLRQQDPSTQTTLRHIYNARNKFRTEELGGRSVMQHLMQSLQDNNYMHLYKALFGSATAALRVSKAIAYWADAAATFNHWMNLADMGLIIATCYNAMVLELSCAQNQTFFPLTVDGGVERLQHQICIAFDHTASHFILLRMSDDSSLPPINKQWQTYRDESVGYLRNAYAGRLHKWEYYAS